MTHSALDGPVARAIAVVIAGGAAFALVHVREADFSRRQSPDAGVSAYFTACMDRRNAAVDTMMSDHVVQKTQAELFRSRAEAMCRAEAAKAAGITPGAPPPLAPGLELAR